MLSKSWLIKFIALSTGILVAMSGLIYLYDPLCYYRMPENRLYVSNVYYSLPGVIRHGRYNSVVLGSSMAQNFMKSTFYEHLKLDIIMLTYGGISAEIMKQLWVNVSKSMKAKVAFIGIDQYLFSGASEANASFPVHLYDSVAVNDYRYLIGYETWMRFFPFIFVSNLADKCGIDGMRLYGNRNYSNFGSWRNDFTFHRDVLIQDYLNNMNQLQEQVLDNLLARMQENATSLITALQEDNKIQMIYFFPPYSALMWYQAREFGYYDEYIQIKNYIVNLLSEYENVKVFDFQAMPLIIDLNNYKDTTHYKGEINDLMVEYFKTGEYEVNSQTIHSSITKLDSLVDQFIRENADWL